MKPEITAIPFQEYFDLEPFLNSLNNQGDDYDFVLIHCYAHIKNGEIYYEIDKDIYEHIIIYEGREFYHAVSQYCFKMKKGAILAYQKGHAPFLKLDAYQDPYDDYDTFAMQIRDLINKEDQPAFGLLADGKTLTVISLKD